ncbi:MAG: SGNH/GDSL hydrolase family protein [Candidatus Heimdallarchaeota archaeon]|nr:SGNH/GDSL hydrolase family protein [Candidatus Heimdallarchaeota archaeon]
MKLRITIGILILLSLNIILINNVTIADSDTTNVVFLGASNTVEEITSVPRNGSYITALRSLNPTWQDVNLIDRATSGWGVGNYHGEVTLLNKTIFGADADYVVVVLGGNDFLRSMSTDRFEIKYRWLLDALLFLDTQSKIKEIFIANIFWGTIELDEVRTATFERFQEVIIEASHDYKFPLLNFFNVTINHPEYYVDSIHLNDLGHKAIAAEVDKIILPYLQGNISRTEDYSKITEIYTNTYSDNSPGFVLTSSALGLILIIVTKKMKKRDKLMS